MYGTYGIRRAMRQWLLAEQICYQGAFQPGWTNRMSKLETLGCNCDLLTVNKIMISDISCRSHFKELDMLFEVVSMLPVLCKRAPLIY